MTTDPISVNSTGDACIPLPLLDSDSSLVGAWPEEPGGSTYCSCTICNGLKCDINECSQNCKIKFSYLQLINQSICWLNITNENNNTHILIWRKKQSRSSEQPVSSDVQVYITFEVATVIEIIESGGKLIGNWIHMHTSTPVIIIIHVITKKYIRHKII